MGAGGDLAQGDVLDLLSNLVEKSLVSMEADGERYRLVETVRQYAQERLDEEGDGNAARSRHLAYFLALAEKASPELVGPDQGIWLARLDLEGENLLAAHAWCDHAEGGAELGLRLIFAVKIYMFYRGLLALLHRATLEALARPSAQQRSPARCRALHTAGQTGFYMGRYGEAQGFLEESLSIAREIGDSGREAMVLQELGSVATGKEDLVAARSYAEQSLVLAEKQGDKRALASANSTLAQLCRMEGDLAAAERRYGHALALARELGDRESIAVGLLNLAMVAVVQGSGEEARNSLLEAMAIAGEIGSKPAGQSALDVSAGLAALRKDWARAARLFGAAEAQIVQTGLQREPGDEAFLAPLIAQARGALGTSAFDATATAGRALGYEEAMAEAREWLEEWP